MVTDRDSIERSMEQTYVDDNDETSRLLRTLPPGISYRTHSINGTQSEFIELPEIYKSRWRSIRVMYLTMFLSSVSFSICMSSLYPFLLILDPDAHSNFLGLVVASYSLGQLVASPLFGAWSNYRSKTREPIVVSLVVNVLANVLYMYLQSVGKHGKIWMLVARALIGFGAGNVAVVRSYVSGATTLKERTSTMANISVFQAIGFIIGPLIQTAMVPIGYPGPVESAALHLNMYTSTAMLSAVVGVVNIVLLLYVFKEHTVKDDHFNDRNIQESGKEEDDNTPDVPLDYFAVISSIILFFFVLFFFAVFETIGTPLSMQMFSWTKKEATLYIGVILGVGGVIAIAVFIVVKILSTRINERYLLLGGFLFCLAGYVTYLPWGNHYPDIQYATDTVDNNTHTMSTTTFLPFSTKLTSTSTTNTTTPTTSFLPFSTNFTTVSSTTVSPFSTETTTANNSTTSSYSQSKKNNTTSLPYINIAAILTNNTKNLHNILTTRTLHKNNGNLIFFKNEKSELFGAQIRNSLNGGSSPNVSVTNGTSGEPVGCPYYYDWCLNTPAVRLWQFLLGSFLVVIGYPTCNLMTYTIYSKILGPKPQGVWMGWLTASGSLARTLGPLFVSQIYDGYGPRITFISMAAIVVLTISYCLVCFRRLIPFTQRVKPELTS